MHQSKLMLLFWLGLLIPGLVFAQGTPVTIYELRTGQIAEGTEIDCTGAVVNSVRPGMGFFCTELGAGPYTAIWVYTHDSPSVSAGDIVNIVSGEYLEYYGLSEIDMGTYSGSVVVTGKTNVPVLYLTVAQLMADQEGWESHLLTLTDGFQVTNPDLGYGEWTAREVAQSVEVRFDDYFYDNSGLLTDDCFKGVTGLYTFSYGDYKLEPLSDGLTIIDCSLVPNEKYSFGALKVMYR